ncbi:importin-9-like [Acanthaster planci]|uniref:Importin-9-like n=1 Tax=Acanthaster planci TaxID=133434 RepID=A0A8B7Z2N5_ACAPL|nr:importin-9-like [Acanthaster planci]
MAGFDGGDVSRSLRDAICDSLTAILSPQQDVRNMGEEQLKVLEVTEEFGVHLAQLTLDPNGALAIRQLASLILKQYVEAHWSTLSEKFRPPVTTDEAKAEIRKMLPMGLRESISKVRSSIAYAISAIASSDWPEAWPELLPELMHLITSGNNDAVHGAMRVLTEFTRDVSDMQMPHVAPVILPEMYRIFVQADVYGIRTRSRAVEIFNECANLIYNIMSLGDTTKNAAKNLLFPILPKFTEAFMQALPVPYGETSDCGLKMEVIKALTTLIKFFPSYMNKWMGQILPSIWTTLTECASIYVATCVNDSEEIDNPVDSDGEVLGFENLIFKIFEFFTAMIETSKFRSLVKKNCGQLMYLLVMYMEITEEQVKQWTDNPNQFVVDEDDDSYSFSVRIAAQELLLALAAEFQQESAVGIVQAVLKHLHDTEQSMNTPAGANWWKIHESCMLSLGSIQSLIIDKTSSGKLTFDMNWFLTNIVLGDLNKPVSPFLLGRALWAASRFSLAMTPELIQRFLVFTVKGLEATQPPAIRISAVRAIYGFSDHLKTSGNTQIIVPYLPEIMEGLIQLATQFTNDILSLVLETISIVLTIDDTFTVQCESKVAPLTIALFLKYSQDPAITPLVEEIFSELCRRHGCQDSLHARLLPTLVSILVAPAEKVPMGLQSTALDILCVIIRNSSVPLSNALINNAFQAMAHCTLKTDDNATMQSGGECLRAYVAVAYDQVASWQDAEGRSGLQYAIDIVTRLLNPSTSEFTAAFVGRLVAILITKAGSALGNNSDMILRGVLSKMQQADTQSVTQSLLMVFAHLMHSCMEDVLEFLSNVPGPTGKPALEFVLTDWVTRQNMFYGAYDNKVSITALSKLLQHMINKQDHRLEGIIVKGDQIFNMDEGIRTRSKAAQAPEQWTSIPLQVKIYKLLLGELLNVMENNVSQQASAGGEDLEDDGWEDAEDEDEYNEEEDGDEGIPSEHGLLAQLSDYSSGLIYPGLHDLAGDEVDEEEDDPDALNDPIYQLDLQAYLTDFMQQLSHQPCHSFFTPHLNFSERQLLSNIGVTV